MTSFFAISCTIALVALPILVLGASNDQRVQITPEKAGTNATCLADMDPDFLKEVLDGIRGTLFPKPLRCNGQDKLCRQMECCFYKNAAAQSHAGTHEGEEGSGIPDDLEAVGVNADRDLAQVVATGECRLQTFYIFIFGGLLLLVLLSLIICCCCLCCCRASQK